MAGRHLARRLRQLMLHKVHVALRDQPRDTPAAAVVTPDTVPQVHLQGVRESVSRQPPLHLADPRRHQRVHREVVGGRLVRVAARRLCSQLTPLGVTPASACGGGGGRTARTASTTAGHCRPHCDRRAPPALNRSASPPRAHKGWLVACAATTLSVLAKSTRVQRIDLSGWILRGEKGKMRAAHVLGAHEA